MATFRARARTVDLLGRQQIAGIPTAFSELFKNAHDAYATRVEADFYRDRDLLVLRDDGVGMTRDEFVERWLTLGTDSKVGSTRGLSRPAVVPGQHRPILGAKGIGRLAIASIGPQVLVLTRAKRKRELSDLTVALVNWRLFELPGINLDELEIPLLTLPGGELPDEATLAELAAQISAEVDSFKLEPAERKPILDDLGRLDFDLGRALRRLGAPKLHENGHGTHFIVVPTTDQLAADIDLAPAREAAPLQQTLIGFANTMLPDSPKPRIATAFRDHQHGSPGRDLIAPAEFFTPTNFLSADHRVNGTFDEMGDFRGRVHVYGADAEPYDFVFTGADRRPLDVGGFAFDLAYVQGSAKDSTLDSTAHAEVIGKLDRIGGLYIYRDDIRVLPYGTPDFDFLGLERRRTENIGRAFFSYRRMFGVIQLTSGVNGRLEEKAGREGFVTNRAYRQFRQLLRDFFTSLAAEFFVERGARFELFEQGREQARRRYEVAKARSARTERARKRFAKDVERLTVALEAGEPQARSAALVAAAESAVKAIPNRPVAAVRSRVENEEGRALTAVEDARRSYHLEEPRGIGLTVALRRDWEWLREQLSPLDEVVWDPAAREISQVVARRLEQLPSGPDREERLQRAVERAERETREQFDIAASELRRTVREIDARAQHLINESDTAIEEGVSAAREPVKRRLAGLTDDEFVELHVLMEAEIRSAGERVARALRDASSGLETWASSGQASSGVEAAVMEEELLELRERVDRDLELAQLGMATQVLTHELDAAIVGIRAALDKLGVYADANPRLSSLRDDLRTGFDHLDTYLSLFTPLQRRLRRRRADVSGRQIAQFIDDLFARRLEDGAVELEVTKAFLDSSNRGFRSTIYPVFVNLVDNASYWVTQGRPPRWIRLDADDGGAWTVSDSGPGVPARDRDYIWQFGFTRKPDGRGAGLNISRQVLKRDGWELALSDRACFRITPASEDVDQ